MPLQPLSLTVAVLATLAWAGAWRALLRLRERAMISLAAGLTLCWLLAATLWLPWLDDAKSYRSVFVSMQPHLPEMGHCVASVSLGESERGMLDFFLGIQTLRRETHPHADCETLLVEAENPPNAATVGQEWNPVWSGQRPDDMHEHFWLYVRKQLSRHAPVLKV